VRGYVPQPLRQGLRQGQIQDVLRKLFYEAIYHPWTMIADFGTAAAIGLLVVQLGKHVMRVESYDGDGRLAKVEKSASF
jgi:hypothetical protein